MILNLKNQMKKFCFYGLFFSLVCASPIWAQNAVLLDDDTVTGGNPAGTTESVMTQTGTGATANLTFGTTGATGNITFNKFTGTGNRLLFTNATGQVNAMSVGTAGQVLVSSGTSAAWTTPSATNLWSLSGNSAATSASFLGTTTAQPLVMKTNNVERLRLNTNGSVAINDAVNTDAYIVTKSTAWNSWMRFGRTVDNGSWYFHNPQTEDGFVILFKNAAGQATYPLTLFNDGTVKMSNKLTIGDGTATMPGDYRLYVTGGILTEKVRVAIKNTTNWADFVFASDYKLRPLFEVEQYIKANCHLPELPSAEQVVEDGVDLAAMDAKLLQKVEELTLYVIELQKLIDQLKQQQTNNK